MKNANLDLSMEFPKDQWAFVYRFGHISFAMLRKCFELEKEFNELTKSSEISYKDFSSLPEFQSISKDFFDHFYLAIISYQTSMEAIIEMCIHEDNDLKKKKITTKNKDDQRSFHERWTDSLKVKGIVTSNIDRYVDTIYKQYRIPLIHPTDENLRPDPENLKKEPFQNIDLNEVLEGFKNGWITFAAISAAIGNPHDVNSWETICGVHQLSNEYEST